LTDEPVSRISCVARPALRLVPKPHRPALRGDHSSRSRIASGLKQPTRGLQRSALPNATHTGRVDPPLLFGLAPRGVFRAPRITAGAVGSYPTFSPLPNVLHHKRRVSGFTGNLPPRCKHHWRFILCGTFRSRIPWRERSPAISNRERPPGVTRRVALPWPSLVTSPRLESGLSSRSLLFRVASRRSPGSSALLIIPEIPSIVAGFANLQVGIQCV
jgi:hypothetical protein